MSRVFQRNGNWWVDYKDADGKRHRRQVGPDRRVAKEALNAVLTKVARREWVGVTDDSNISFEAFADIWTKRVLVALRPSTARRWQGILRNHLLPAFQGRLRALELGRVEQFVAARLEAGASPGCINREVEVLKHILRRARAWKDGNGDRYLARDPLGELKPLREPPGRVRFLDHDELQRLLAACDDATTIYLRPFVLVALNTGMRRGEILSLSRRSIDWQHRTARLETSKNGESRCVHLNETAFAALNSLPARIDGRLFPYSSPSTISRSFDRACKRADVPNFRLHDLRHHFASTQSMAGTPTRALQSLMGHKDMRMTQRYSHLSDDYLKRAVNQVNIGVAPSAPVVKVNA